MSDGPGSIVCRQTPLLQFPVGGRLITDSGRTSGADHLLFRIISPRIVKTKLNCRLGNADSKQRRLAWEVVLLTARRAVFRTRIRRTSRIHWNYCKPVHCTIIVGLAIGRFPLQKRKRTGWFSWSTEQESCGSALAKVSLSALKTLANSAHPSSLNKASRKINRRRVPKCLWESLST